MGKELSIKQNNLDKLPGFEVMYRGKMFEIINFEGQSNIKFEVAVRAPGTRLIIETEKDGQKALLMTKEIRREVEGYDFRLPGGKVFDSLEQFDLSKKNEDDISLMVKNAAEKEGKEEAGIRGGDYEYLGVSKDGASVEWDLHYFKVTNAEFGEQELEEYEQGNIEIIILSAKEIFEKLSRREIQEGRSADMLWFWLQQNGFLNFQE